MSKKRPDLQGIRGLAILAVLLFHFFPEISPNGYVGVDQFFILSGYLMALILSRENTLNFSVLYNFYYRRMKRILPLYVLFIMVTFSLSLWLFPIEIVEFNIPHALRSLGFVSNMYGSDDQTNYQMMILDAEILYTHTWSLSAEVQFYALAPFIILVSLYIPSKIYVGLLFLLGAVSCFFFNFAMQFTSTKSLSFNSMPTRIWQFLLGVMCCSITKLFTTPEAEKIALPAVSEKSVNTEETKVKSASEQSLQIICTVCLVCSTLVAFYPWPLQQSIVRFLVCFQTASLIFSGANVSSKLLSNTALVYLGDISYSLYLIHWPVYVYVKQNYEGSLTAQIIGLALSVVAASICYETYEKFYLKQDQKIIIPLCIVLYLVTFGVIFYFKPVDVTGTMTKELIYVPKTMTREQVSQLNTRFNQLDLKLLDFTEGQCTPIEGSSIKNFCKFENLKLSGKKRVMLLGNSWTRNIARMIIQNNQCLDSASEIFMMSRNGCEVFDDHMWWCIDHNKDYFSAVEHVKPDVIFTLTRFTKGQSPIVAADPDLIHEKQQLVRLAKLVKEKIFILTGVPTVNTTIFTQIEQGMKSGKLPTYEDLVDHPDLHENSRLRMAQITKGCRKCRIVDIKPTFMMNETFNFYNPSNTVQYFSTNLHLTDYGLAKVAPEFSKACEAI